MMHGSISAAHLQGVMRKNKLSFVDIKKKVL